MTPKKGSRGVALERVLLEDIENLRARHQWPSTRWRDDPVGFFYDVLMVEYLSDDQVSILEAVNKPRARVSVSSGHKMGKDFIVGGVSLWWYCGDLEARVRATAVTLPQVRDVFWREVRAHHMRSHFHLDKATQRLVPSPYPIDGRPNLQPGNGLRVGSREIVGFTAEQKEGAAGISGRRVLYIFDEASGIDDSIFEAAAGNLAGGDARVIMLSQPTRNRGYFFQSHHENRGLWKCFVLDSEQSPNVIAGRDVVPGMATKEWLDEQRVEWNAPDGPLWRMRVKGQFVEGKDMIVVPLGAIVAAERRWAVMPEPDDRLVVGYDVAGTGDDENVVAPRRGMKVLELEAWAGTSVVGSAPQSTAAIAKANVSRVLQVVRRHRRPRDWKPLVVFDGSGTVGIEVYAQFRHHEAEVDVAPVHFGALSPKKSAYPLMRDHLWFEFAEQWLAAGGALPPDKKLAAELSAPSWEYDEKQRRHVEKKRKLRARLGRSTDRADAVILSCYVPPSHEVAQQAEEEERSAPTADLYELNADPYSHNSNPYGDSA